MLTKQEREHKEEYPSLHLGLNQMNAAGIRRAHKDCVEHPERILTDGSIASKGRY